MCHTGTHNPDVSKRRLYVEFEVETSPEASCPLKAFDRDIERTRRQTVDGTCHADTTLSTAGDGAGSEVVHTISEVEPACFCPVFEELGCIPEVTDVTGEKVRIETLVPDRELLSDLVDGLKSVSQGLYLRRLKRIESEPGTDRTETVELPLHEVTEKQREAVTKAVSIGYYDRPRETSLRELAASLDISKSACSQRLNAVESTLAVSAFAV